jgi:photosystem II stability/assembly factor-like uncharacterized protein
MKRFGWFQVAIIALLAGFLASAVPTAAAQEKRAAGDASKALDALKNLKFRELGPAIMGGRVDDFAVDERDPKTVYVGLASGGVWKTTNAGTTWEPLFDKEAVSTIGDLALAPSDSSILWVGTGEPNNRQSSSWGNGVYKSTDGGKTFQRMGLEETRHIGRIVIHPTNPDIVYVAALGHLWGPNHERGVFKTTDGGKTWTQSLYINDDTGVVDIAIDPQSPDTLYAAAYERRRTPYGFVGGGPNGAIYKTTDGGANWKKLTKGLPYENGGDVGRIGLDVYRKNPSIVYAIVQHSKGGVFRSEDKGETWTKMSDTNPRASYYSQIHIDPANDLRIWVLGAPMYYSEDGGKTFTTRRVTRIHGDYHAMWINPADSNQMIVGSDGGIHWTWDAGKTWDFVNTIAIGQFYEVGLDMSKPYKICGGLQDNGSWCGPSRSLSDDGIINEEWVLIHGGDGFYAQIDPADPNTVYAESQDGNLSRRDMKTMEQRSIRPEMREGEAPYRFQWNSPVVISAHDHHTIYYGGNFLFKSTNRGDTWTRLGGDLTTGVDRNKLPILGKVPDKDTLSRHDGVQQYPTITTISESPLTASVLWVGTDDGNLQVTRDGGQNWKNVATRVPGVPKGTYVSRVVASKYAEGTAYAAFDGHRSDDYNVYIYMTTDYGENWKNIGSGIPKTAGTVSVVREHPRNQNLLFAGTEFGLWISWDRGASWSPLRMNLPTVPVDDIAIHPRENDLVLGTHGRSIWVFDDLTPIEKLDAATLASDLTLFDVRPTTAWRLSRRRWSSGHKKFTAPNSPEGAIVTYYLKNAVPPPEPPKTDDKDAAQAAEPEKEGQAKITILDKDGKVVREMDGPGRAGLNRINWDLRYNAPAQPTPQQLEAIQAGYGFGPRGPRVDPGEYTIKVSASGKEATKTVAVEEDPRISLSPADRTARRDAVMKLYELAKTTDKDRRTFTGLRGSLVAALEQWKKEAEKPGAPKIPENIRKAAEALKKKVDDFEPKLVRPREPLGSAGPPFVWRPDPLPERVQDLLNDVDGYSAVPSGQQLAQLEEFTKLVAEVSAELKKLIDEDLAGLNKMMNEAGIPHIRPSAAEPARPGGR